MGVPPLTLEVTSAQKADYYTPDSSPDRTLSPAPGNVLLVVKVRMCNRGEAWASFASTRFAILDESGEDVRGVLGAVDDSLAPTDGSVTVKSTSYDANEVEVFRFKGTLSSHVSVVEWELAGGREHAMTLVYAIPEDVRGPRLILKKP